MDAVIEAEETGVEDTRAEAEVERISSVSLSCEAGTVYADQPCELKEGQVLQDDGEILLVQGLQDYQGVISETVVVDDSRQQQSALSRTNTLGSYQQYQPLVVQGFVTSSGEVVHVVQDTPASGVSGGSGGHRTHSAHSALNPSANLPSQTYQHPYQHQAQHQAQHQMMHPDLYRLIKMFPDFSTKTLHRIFVMCRCDLKRSLDQALFARQFRQLDSAQSYSPVAPASSPHFAPAPHPYRAPASMASMARPPYVQMGVDLGDAYLPRGRASHGTTAAPAPQSSPPSPILLYQQACTASMQHLGRHVHDVDHVEDAEVVEIKLADLASDGQGLGDSLRLLTGTGLDGDGAPILGPGGDSVKLERCDKGDESKDMLPDLAEVTVEDSSHVTETEADVVC